MRKFLLCLSLLAVIIVPIFAFAQEANPLGSLTKYAPGTCIEHEGGQWQQLPDGTWAPPGDPLNTCALGVPNSWIGNPYYDPWYRAGFEQNMPYWDRMSQYPWGDNYPGGYDNNQDWLTNCVLMRSILPRPECQAFPRYGSMLPYNVPWSNMFGQSLYFQTRIGDNANLSVEIPLKDRVSSGLQYFLLGWAINMAVN
ncbi:MAG: hypothetical protein OEV37_02110 [Candidatus Berkelbacteria bacterium]|nr:hypothetical protein [Candidatus Berkelbacteria bacterium]